MKLNDGISLEALQTDLRMKTQQDRTHKKRTTRMNSKANAKKEKSFSGRTGNTHRGSCPAELPATHIRNTREVAPKRPCPRPRRCCPGRNKCQHIRDHLVVLCRISVRRIIAWIHRRMGNGAAFVSGGGGRVGGQKEHGRNSKQLWCGVLTGGVRYCGGGGASAGSRRFGCVQAKSTHATNSGKKVTDTSLPQKLRHL